MDTLKKYDVLVFIGRFQPLHLGHQEVIEKALSLADNVLLLIGSANQARNLRNPFTYRERAKLITSIYPDVHTRPLEDLPGNDDVWVDQVWDAVQNFCNYRGLKLFLDARIGLIGCNKDATCYYLNLFPAWESEAIEFVDPINATALRQQYFGPEMPPRHEWESLMHHQTYVFLEQFRNTSDFKTLVNTVVDNRT